MHLAKIFIAPENKICKFHSLKNDRAVQKSDLISIQNEKVRSK